MAARGFARYHGRNKATSEPSLEPNRARNSVDDTRYSMGLATSMSGFRDSLMRHVLTRLHRGDGV